MNNHQSNNRIYQERHNIYKERRRQASWSFNIFCGFSGVSGLVGIAAIILLLSGRVSEGVFTVAGGGIYSNAIALGGSLRSITCG